MIRDSNDEIAGRIEAAAESEREDRDAVLGLPTVLSSRLSHRTNPDNGTTTIGIRAAAVAMPESERYSLRSIRGRSATRFMSPPCT
jgi:hypothetical protein